MKTIKMTIDRDVLERYTEHYFGMHPRAKKPPIKQPYHESINTWMVLRRPAMNALKQKWKEFIKWFVSEQGYDNLHIQKCEIIQSIFYPTKLRHDVDNSTPKFILDGLVECGMIEDDDCKHLQRLTLECSTSSDYPRTELQVIIYE